jgi:8-oxo-dGTP pyrophosphatase MutT (NUDIX family)
MKLVFSEQPIPRAIIKSIFLAGPSPRDKQTRDWRIDALAWLEQVKFTGTVFLPIPSARFYGGDDAQGWHYDGQVQWECAARHAADQIVFWVPRDIQGGMPAFTTNIEFGEDLGSGKLVYGRPPKAEKCRYMDKRVEDLKETVHDTLESTLQAAVNALGEGALREGGAVCVPLFIWNTPQFTEWYAQLNRAGNRLEGARLLHHFKLPNRKILSFTLAVSVWIKSEDRVKSNEFIVSRPDISTVVAFHDDGLGHVDSVKVLLIKEFRSPVRNENGVVVELPGGSTSDPSLSASEVALHEFQEETGISIADPSRLMIAHSGQINATFSTHWAHVFKIQLSDDELKRVAHIIDKDISFGVEGESECTHLKLAPLSTLPTVDMDIATYGMIAMALK